MPKLTWSNLEDIALALYDMFPDQDPSYIRFTDLHKWITELDEFEDDPKKSNEAKLEAIQMAWIDEYKEGQCRDCRSEPWLQHCACGCSPHSLRWRRPRGRESARHNAPRRPGWRRNQPDSPPRCVSSRATSM